MKTLPISLSHLPRAFLRASALALVLHVPAALAFDLQGHRGARGLAPENTLAGFERTLAVGVTTLELDVGVTADGVPVIAHDPALNPAITRDASGQWLRGAGPRIADLTRAQLALYDVGRIDPASPYATTFTGQQARDGERIPALADLFALAQRVGAADVRFNIELKTNPTQPAGTVPPRVFVEAVLGVIRQAGVAPTRVTIQSFDWSILKLVRDAAPEFALSFLSIQNARTDNTRDAAWNGGMLWRDYPGVPAMVKAAGGAVWSPNFQALQAPLVKEAQALGLQVIPWTVNDPADMRRLIDWGVDGLITDYPDRLRELLQARGQPLPRPYPSR
ncbi:MAG: glycerophosphodiester phosphodiesterase [Burkholderiales bacterium]|nr:glycerophosphodiester phosphodiesterase [Burkholderiales bacterium]